MIRLLIVDDEPHIVDWLRAMLSDHFTGDRNIEMEVFGAYNAIEALDLLTKDRIDIIITDIRMPHLSGLELMRRVRENWPDCRLILLTAYSDFDALYAVSSGKNVRYLLKTEDDQTIISAVAQYIVELDAERCGGVSLAGHEDEDRYALMKQHFFFSQFLSGHITAADPVYDIMGQYSIEQTRGTPFFLMLSAFDRELDLYSHEEELISLRRMIHHYVSFRFSVAQHMVDQSVTMWLFQPQASDAPHESHLRVLVGHLDSLLESNRNGRQLRLLVMEEPTTLPQLIPLLNRAMQLWHMNPPAIGSILTGAVNTYQCGDAVQYAIDPMVLASRLAMIPQLESALESGRRDDAHSILNELTYDIAKARSFNDMSAVGLYYSVALAMLNVINRNRLAEKVAFRVGIGAMMNLSEHPNWRQAVSYLFQVSLHVSELQASRLQMRTDDIGQRIKSYIDAHLSGPLSLAHLSSQFHYNSSYLSRVFKMHTGLNLNAYIIDARIGKACELLRSGAVSIASVAVSAGFENAQYFSTVFRRRMGMTPQAYRSGA